MEIEYSTRDGKGNDIIKMVNIKEFPSIDVEFDCPVCKRHCKSGHVTKKCVSANFTDWAYLGEYICSDCSRLLSMYFYNYSVENGEIHIFNVREVKQNIMRHHKTPFRFIITKSAKKHLFYRSYENTGDDNFAVQLEDETIFTNRNRMEKLFTFVESMQALGQGKEQMKGGEIRFDILQKVGMDALTYLNHELKISREIQIPLFVGQKQEITEEEAICNITSILKA